MAKPGGFLRIGHELGKPVTEIPQNKQTNKNETLLRAHGSFHEQSSWHLFIVALSLSLYLSF